MDVQRDVDPLVWRRERGCRAKDLEQGGHAAGELYAGGSGEVEAGRRG